MGILQNKLSNFSVKTEATIGPVQKRKIKIVVGSREKKGKKKKQFSKQCKLEASQV